MLKHTWINTFLYKLYTKAWISQEEMFSSVCNWGLPSATAAPQQKCSCRTFTHPVIVCTWSPKGAPCFCFLTFTVSRTAFASVCLVHVHTASLIPAAFSWWDYPRVLYVWKHSCASLIPPISHKYQNTSHHQPVTGVMQFIQKPLPFLPNTQHNK